MLNPRYNNKKSNNKSKRIWNKYTKSTIPNQQRLKNLQPITRFSNKQFGKKICQIWNILILKNHLKKCCQASFQLKRLEIKIFPILILKIVLKKLEWFHFFIRIFVISMEVIITMIIRFKKVFWLIGRPIKYFPHSQSLKSF